MSEPNKQGTRDERRHDDLPGDGRDSDDASDVHQLLSNFDFGDLLASVDAFDSGDAEGGDEVDLVPDEETDAIAYGPDQELAVAALSGVPDIAAPKRRKKDEGLRTFTEEDFEEGVERICFKMVSANVECLFDRKRKPEDYIKAAHWVFGRTLGDFTFERCCIALGTRKDVLRLRIHYEFWRRWYVFPIEFPFLIDPVPDSVEGEIYMLAGDEGYALARAAWMHPGIRSIQLLEVSAAATEAKGKKRPSEDRMREALKLLSEKYLMSQYNDSWYLTGRNPVLRAMDLSSAPNRVSRTHLSWSRMF